MPDPAAQPAYKKYCYKISLKKGQETWNKTNKINISINIERERQKESVSEDVLEKSIVVFSLHITVNSGVLKYLKNVSWKEM